MDPYEIRLLTNDGTTTFFYVTHCAGDDDALRTLEHIKTIHYARYEIWCGLRKVCDGDCPKIPENSAA